MGEREILATVGGIPASYPEGEIELQVLVSGNVGARLALWGESAGWRRFRRPAELRAIHESSHLIVAAVRGRAIYGATIKSDSTFLGPRGQFSGGQVWTGGAPKDQSRAEIERRIEWPESDGHRAAVLSLILTPNDEFQRWRGALRAIRAAQRKAAGLLVANWLILQRLAEQLERRGTLTGNEIAQLLGRA
jgi:hypothetical protein